MYIVDGYDIEMWPEQREKWGSYQVEANDTFIEVVKQVRGIVDDEEISIIAWDANTGANWPLGLYELLIECNLAGVVLPEELLERCLESDFDEDRPIAREVEELRARAREAASG